MKLVPLIIMMAASASYASVLEVPIRHVTDGDTIAGTFPLPYPLSNISIRIYGIDTPEKGSLAKCKKEADLARQASSLSKAIVGNNKTMMVYDFKYDKYGGRILGRVEVNGVDVGSELIKQGLAYPYYGGTKRSWCK